MLAAVHAVLQHALKGGVRVASTSAPSQDVLRFCVVGSGPSGFYTVDKLLKRFGDEARVDIVEALPTPFGLVRSGVAPDHPDTKNVIHQFTQLAHDPRVSFLGNVRVGSPALPLATLRAHYNAVVLAYGAESDRRLGIPGEALPGVVSAREFVRWYNGHPAGAALPVDLRRVHSVAICGLGNVALDCARVLLRPVADLAATDMAAYAVAALQKSGVREVHILARRGPAQAACTPKELRELLSLEGIALKVHPPGALELAPQCEAEVKGNRIRRRVVEEVTKATQQSKSGSPIEFLPSARDGRAAGVRLEATALRPATSPGASQQAAGIGVHEDLPAGLILESIGYRSVPLEGAAFDPSRGVIPNELGQALVAAPGSPEGGAAAADPGLFVCGWLKRGPTGIIGTNLVDAEQTVDTMVRRRGSFPPVSASIPGGEGLRAVLKEQGVQVVSLAGWDAIDAEEVQRGRGGGKPREKITSVQEMLRIAAAAEAAAKGKGGV